MSKRNYCPRGMPTMERLEYRSIPEPNTGCWLWTASVDSCGYGTIRVGDFIWRAHRLMWSLLHGEIPHGMLVCHKCDTPACINPQHLFLGTDQDNMNDSAKKGRRARNGSSLPFGASRRAGRYRARVKHRRKTYLLGMFDTAEEASAVASAFKDVLLSKKD